jgi:hypothetical protein
MASDRRAGRPARGLGRGRLHVDRAGAGDADRSHRRAKNPDCGVAVSALGTLLFGLFATGLWSGAFFNAIAGIGFAGAYMPGLKALTDRLAPGDSSRAITLYTSSFSFGVGLSFLVSQLVAEAWAGARLSWRPRWARW